MTVSGCSGACYVDGFSIVTGGATGGRNAIAIFLLNSPGARISHNTISAHITAGVAKCRDYLRAHGLTGGRE